MLDAHGEELAETALDMARGGDGVTARFCLRQVLGVPRGRPVELDLPEVRGPGDLAAAAAAITAAVADGRITPDEALALSQTLDGVARVLAASQAAPTRAEPARSDEEIADDARRVLAERLKQLAEGRAGSGL